MTRSLRQGHREHAVGEIGRNRLDVDVRRKFKGAREGAVAALDLVEVNDVAGGRVSIDSLTTNRQPRIFERKLDVFACKSGHLRGDDVAILRFIDVDGRGPGVGVVIGQSFEPFLPHAEVTKWVPRHTW